ncbi:hypothetical protein [Aquidulcibacter sp.]|uniref:hypothetical protein n=1 Tax=Aquidulcibacter sp. TaxID=2052990 RepID=UPI0025BD391A|nr:hypothetical protein [Aquidulcibacter sp.]MCA3696776.1 hypothetical protein [Aquidulcibacter sp.]
MAAHPFGSGQLPTWAEIIALFIQMGCSEKRLPLSLFDETGEKTPVRYLFNPENRAFAPIFNYGDHTKITRSEIEFLERTLDINIPKSPKWGL